MKWTDLRTYWSWSRRFGARRVWRYERERRRREKIYGPFVPEIHGAGLLRAIGATEEEIAKAKEMGLA